MGSKLRIAKRIENGSEEFPYVCILPLIDAVDIQFATFNSSSSLSELLESIQFQFTIWGPIQLRRKM